MYRFEFSRYSQDLNCYVEINNKLVLNKAFFFFAPFRVYWYYCELFVNVKWVLHSLFIDTTFIMFYGIAKYKIEKKFSNIKYVSFWVFCKYMMSAYVMVDYAFNLCHIIFMMYFFKWVLIYLKYVWKCKYIFFGLNDS